MSPETILQIGNQALWMAILLAGPILLVALLVGVVAVLVVAGPWMLMTMVDWFRELVLDIPLLIG